MSQMHQYRLSSHLSTACGMLWARQPPEANALMSDSTKLAHSSSLCSHPAAVITAPTLTEAAKRAQAGSLPSLDLHCRRPATFLQLHRVAPRQRATASSTAVTSSTSSCCAATTHTTST
jgi:hypothetical protein